MTVDDVSKASYKPTEGMKAEARRGLEWRREFNRGGTAVGVARARDIINGKELSAETVMRMHSFFSRHRVDSQGQGFRQGQEGYPSAGRIAHALWGGDAGRTWAKKIRDRIVRERKEGGMYEYEKENKSAMDCLLMAYSSMMSYTFEGAHEMRAKLMEMIHELEHVITEQGGERVDIETGYMDEEYRGLYIEKEIVERDGQYCVTSADGGRNFGCYRSMEQAQARLEQIESFANKLKSMSPSQVALAYVATGKALEGMSIYQVHVLAEEEIERRDNDISKRIDGDAFDLVPIMKSEQRYTMGPVYVPNYEDAHGETIDESTLQKAIWEWVREGDRSIMLQHSDKVAGEMVEILTLPMETEMSLTVPNQGVTKYTFPENTPFMGVIWEDWAWELVKAGKLRGYSIGGQAARVEMEVPDELLLT